MTESVKIKQKPAGSPYGIHRVIEPQGVLPQPANRIDNSTNILWDNEILVDVDTLNIDSASFAQIKNEANDNIENIKNKIIEIVNARGKMHNPVTGSGGMFIGKIAELGKKLTGKINLKPGDKIASLVSLSLTPLYIEEILDVKIEIEQVKIKGKAVLFESSIYALLPDDLPESLALAVLDVAGAPAQTRRLIKPGATVVIFGATGKSGVLCAYEAKKITGEKGRVIGVGHSEQKINALESLNICDEVLKLDARDAIYCYEEISKISNGKLADVVINCVNIPDTEMSSILCCRDRGSIYFFSMATSFTKAALGAEGIGKDVDMIIGNGYALDHAEIALNIIRESKCIRDLYESIYS